MKAISVTDNIYRLGADAHDILFESMWPVPHGVTMNSYLVRGRRVALIDGVCGWDGVPEHLYEGLDELGMTIDDIDYLVLNHLEPDHTGWIKSIFDIGAEVTIVATKRGVDLAQAFYGLDVEYRAVASGDVIDLGNDVALRFQEIPNVHWPETMATLEESTRTLFTGDAFGAFGAVGNRPFDDQRTSEELEFFEREALRYFSNVLGAFHKVVGRAIETLSRLSPSTIAPAHGLVWRKRPDRILDDYRRYVSYPLGKAKPIVTVLWASMYGMTAEGVAPVIRGIEDEGVEVREFRVPGSEVSDILASVWESTGVVIGCPTYEYAMFPAMAEAVEELGRKRVGSKVAFRFGSYGWSGGATKHLEEICARTSLKWDFLNAVEFRGPPDEEDLGTLYAQGSDLAKVVRCSATAVPSL